MWGTNSSHHIISASLLTYQKKQNSFIFWVQTHVTSFKKRKDYQYIMTSLQWLHERIYNIMIMKSFQMKLYLNMCCCVFSTSRCLEHKYLITIFTNTHTHMRKRLWIYYICRMNRGLQCVCVCDVRKQAMPCCSFGRRWHVSVWKSLLAFACQASQSLWCSFDVKVQRYTLDIMRYNTRKY